MFQPPTPTTPKINERRDHPDKVQVYADRIAIRPVSGMIHFVVSRLVLDPKRISDITGQPEVDEEIMADIIITPLGYEKFIQSANKVIEEAKAMQAIKPTEGDDVLKK